MERPRLGEALRCAGERPDHRRAYYLKAFSLLTLYTFEAGLRRFVGSLVRTALPRIFFKLGLAKYLKLWYINFWVNLRLDRGFALFLFAPHFPRPGLCPCREGDPRHLWCRSSRVLVGARLLLQARESVIPSAERDLLFSSL